MRQIALWLVLVVVVVVVAGVGRALSNPEALTGQPPYQPQPPREVPFTPCPSVVLTSLPDDFAPTHRELKALEDNHMGSVETFSNGRQTIRVYSGVDAIDVLEDLDFVSRHVEAGGHEFLVHSTTVFPDLLVGHLRDEDLKEPCDSVGVQTMKVTSDAMVQLLAGLEVRERGEQWGINPGIDG